MRWHHLLLLAISLSFLGCASWQAHYDIRLSAVEKPAHPKLRYGPKYIEQIESDSTYVYEDEKIKIEWVFTAEEISFALTNKTEYSLRIIWDEAIYVDLNGGSHRMAHTGIKYIDIEKPQSPSNIISGGSITETAFPADHIYWSIDHWRKTPLFPIEREYKVSTMTREYETPKELQQRLQVHKGKSVKVLLPIETEGMVNDYVFVFRIADISIKEIPSQW